VIEEFKTKKERLMGIARCLGIGITMIIPSFVGGGALWDIFNSWAAVLVWIVSMAVVYGIILSKLHCSAE
jgi:hypothetical protein